MEKAELNGMYAMPKGLRHAFAIACIDRGLSLNMVQKWLDHTLLKPTAIYVNAMDQEERMIASRLWK